MGYDVHITRRNDWRDSRGPEISLDEWRAFVLADSQMRLDSFAEASLLDGRALRTEAGGFAVWTEYSQHDEAGNKAWFLYSHGEIRVENPDDEIIRKMWSIAQALGAKVQGDDGEVYDSSASESYPDITKPWWKFW